MERLCEALDVSRSGFHAWLNRSPSARARQDEVLVTKIDRNFETSERTYSARRIWHDVLAEGLYCGLHRIERLMRENGLRARPRRRGLPKDTGERAAVSDSLLDRAVEASAPNQKWIADFTYIWTAEGWLRCRRRRPVLSQCRWLAEEDHDDGAICDRRPHHGDLAPWQAGQPAALQRLGEPIPSEQFQRLMADHGITCSMSRSGNVWDNVAIERFFSSLKAERTAVEFTGRKMMHGPTCSTTSSASTILGDGSRHWAI